MLLNLTLGITTMVVCLFVQGVLVVSALRFYARRLGRAHLSFLAAMRVTSAQVSVWALVFLMLGEFETLEVAFYHSGVNFATLGYGDIVMSLEHRILGPLEAINGALMIGVSTAALSRAFREVLVAVQGEEK